VWCQFGCARNLDNLRIEPLLVEVLAGYLWELGGDGSALQLARLADLPLLWGGEYQPALPKLQIDQFVEIGSDSRS
jgi:hypothetical protein